MEYANNFGEKLIFPKKQYKILYLSPQHIQEKQSHTCFHKHGFYASVEIAEDDVHRLFQLPCHAGHAQGSPQGIKVLILVPHDKYFIGLLNDFVFGYRAWIPIVGNPMK